MTVETLSFTAAFLIGLLGGAHCIGMCGGITGTFGLNSQGSLVERLIKNLSFNLGRISSYILIGLIVGLVSSLLTNLSPTIGMILRLVAGIFIILMGLYVADWSRAITKIEKPGQWVWKHIQPLTKPFLPADTLKKSLFLGLLWGWLPCGLVYSTLVLASANASPTSSAMVMAAFGLGTLPTMLATGLLASQLSNIIRNKNVRNLAAIMMILMGAWIIWGNSQHLLGHGDHSSHNNHMNHSSHSNHSDHTNHSDHENHDSSNTSNHEGHSMHDHSAMQTESQVDHSTMDHSQMDHSQMDHSGMNHSQMDHTDMSSDTRKQDHSQMDHSKMDHSKMNH